MFDEAPSQSIHDRRPRYPEPVRVMGPRGIRAAVKRAAEADGKSASQFIREAIAEKVRAR